MNLGVQISLFNNDLFCRFHLLLFPCNTGEIKMRHANLNFSQHSRKRMQQRGISDKAVFYLLNYGDIHFDGHGGNVYSLTKLDRKILLSDIGREEIKNLNKQLDSYVVVGNDSNTVITVGHKTRRRKK